MWVIRLFRINLVIKYDLDMPLANKVASIPKKRDSVYFIDNDEYFKGSHIYWWDGTVSDSDERSIFFAKGVVQNS
jgi:hypothetical protein